MSDSLQANLHGATSAASATLEVMEGDSITYGINLATADSWPAKFAGLTGLPIDNIGMSGYLLADMVNNFSSRTGAQYDATKTDNEVFLLGGANDVIYNHATASQLETYVTEFASAAIAKGFDKIWVGTIMDGTSKWYSSDDLSHIHEFNSWLRANYASVGISGVVDYAAQPGLTDPSNTTYFQDGLHPTAAGTTIMSATAEAARVMAGADSTATASSIAGDSVVSSTKAISGAADPTTVAVGTSSSAGGTPSIVSAAPAEVATTHVAASGSDLTLHVSGDLWNGGPKFTVSVDGHQVGGVYEVTADHASGALQDVTIADALGAGTHTVAVSFVNDGHGYATHDPATGWHMNDRNLYVSGLDVGGVEVGSDAVTSNTASGGCDWLDPHAAVMVSNGTATFSVQVGSAQSVSQPSQANLLHADSAAAATQASGASAAAGSDTLSFRVSGDLWQGGPQFQVSVDGHALDGLHEVTANHGEGAWQDVAVTGDFGAGAHTVSVSFVNDGHGAPVFDPATGWQMNDRNLYVSSVSADGAEFGVGAVTGNTASGGCDWLDPNAAVMVSNGTATFGVQIGPAQSPPATAAQAAATQAASGSDTLSFRVSGDLWQGGPEFTVSVDGHQLDGVHEVTANHATQGWQDVAVSGAFGSGPHVVDVTFVNDGHGTPVYDPTAGWQMNDRNLYVGAVTLNDHHADVSAVVANTASGGCDWLDPHAAVLVANGTASFLLS